MNYSEVYNKVEDLLRVAEDRFKISMPLPKVSFDVRGRTAGKANVGTWEIKLNKVLLSDNFDYYINETIPHEVAHLVAYRAFGYGIKPHGKEWKYVMRVFGCEPKRCHSMDVKNVTGRKARRYKYACDCSTHMITSIRHRRILNGQSSYTCRSCKTRIMQVDFSN